MNKDEQVNLPPRCPKSKVPELPEINENQVKRVTPSKHSPIPDQASCQTELPQGNRVFAWKRRMQHLYISGNLRPGSVGDILDPMRP